MCEILYISFKSEVYFSQSFGTLKIKLHWNSKPNALGNHPPGAGPIVQGCLMWGSELIILLQLVCHPPGGMAFDYVSSPPLLVIALWFFLYVFSFKRLFLTACNHFN